MISVTETLLLLYDFCKTVLMHVYMYSHMFPTKRKA